MMKLKAPSGPGPGHETIISSLETNRQRHILDGSDGEPLGAGLYHDPLLRGATALYGHWKCGGG